ncbi:MAG: TolC family protein [Phycisphaerae bacterium]|nr:TolC family protein [Phycisphaerae bacterium]
MKRNFTIYTGFFFSVGLLLLILCSFTVAPQGHLVAPVPLPAAHSDSVTTLLPDKWWQAFEDATLDTLIEEGLANIFSIRTARDRLRQAEHGREPICCRTSIIWGWRSKHGSLLN